MRRPFPLLITLPVLAISFKPVAAETVSPIEAVSLLSKARALAAKCGTLGEGERQELADYVAKAEVAAAQRGSAQEANAAVSEGRASGEQALCGPEATAEVNETLGAARQAMATVKQRQADIESKSRRLARKRLPPRTASALKAAPRPKVEPPTAAEIKAYGKEGLGGYAGAAMAYYVERRCRHLSRSEAQSFWKAIVKRHAAAMANNSRAKVAAALRGAEADAKAQRCGSTTATLVRTAYADIRRQ